MLSGVVSMPPNIFANTGTNVSILFIDNNNSNDEIVLINASDLGVSVKDGKAKRTVLTPKDEDKIIATFNNKEGIEEFSAVVNHNDIAECEYSFNAGHYFDIKIEYMHFTELEFTEKIKSFEDSLEALFNTSHNLENQILKNFNGLSHEDK